MCWVVPVSSSWRTSSWLSYIQSTHTLTAWQHAWHAVNSILLHLVTFVILYLSSCRQNSVTVMCLCVCVSQAVWYRGRCSCLRRGRHSGTCSVVISNSLICTKCFIGTVAGWSLQCTIAMWFVVTVGGRWVGVPSRFVSLSACRRRWWRTATTDDRLLTCQSLAAATNEWMW